MEKRFSGLVPRDGFCKVLNGPAPWETEPDVIVGTYRGYVYVIIRHPYYGTLNGYLAVPQRHTWYNKPYYEIPAEILSEDGEDLLWHVHGGLTYADDHLVYPDMLEVVVPGAPVWWVGFDTCHSCDFTLSGFSGSDNVVNYRTVGYVFEQLLNLTRKATEVDGPGPDILPEVHVLTDTSTSN